MIYLDNSATTSLHPEVVDAMLPYLREEYGNPSSKYYTLAENAKLATETARQNVAELLGCQPEEVVFTSGATESNNMVLKGVADSYKTEGKAIITSQVEHPSVLETARYLESSRGFDITYLPVDSFGRISIDTLKETMEVTRPILVSIIWANNELGSRNDIDQIAKQCMDNGVFFHTDATQIVGKEAINVSRSGINFLSCSAHKIHGPKGIGACVIRKHRLGFKTKITPLLHGGGQENEYRSGTLSVHNIVGFGKAAELAIRDIKSTEQHLKRLEDYLLIRLSESFAGAFELNSDTATKVPGIVNIRFPGINNEFLIKSLSDKVAISTGSACSSTKPSHVLQSIGLSLDSIRSSVRISMSKFNTMEDIDSLLNLLA